MREPSTQAQLLRWHRDAIAGLNPERHEGQPEAGWYKMQQVKNGPWVPVLIWCDQDIDPDTGELTGDETLAADVYGDMEDAAKIWTWLTAISEDEYDRLIQWRLRNQHRYQSKQAIDLAAQPTLPTL